MVVSTSAVTIRRSCRSDVDQVAALVSFTGCVHFGAWAADLRG